MYRRVGVQGKKWKGFLGIPGTNVWNQLLGHPMNQPGIANENRFI